MQSIEHESDTGPPTYYPRFYVTNDVGSPKDDQVDRMSIGIRISISTIVTASSIAGRDSRVKGTSPPSISAVFMWLL
jgi:hypothetical protein